MAALHSQLAIAVRQRHLVMFKFRYLSLFYREYWRLMRFCRLFNRQVARWMNLIAVLANLSLNVLLIGVILFQRKLSPPERAVLFTFLAFQSAAALAGTLKLARWSDCFNIASSLLYSVQLRLASKNGDPLYRRSVMTTAKLRLMGFYEQVCRQERFRFSVGHLGKVSRKSLLDFAIVYSGLAMYFAKMVRKGRV